MNTQDEHRAMRRAVWHNVVIAVIIVVIFYVVFTAPPIFK